jgi:hypothetical protein
MMNWMMFDELDIECIALLNDLMWSIVVSFILSLCKASQMFGRHYTLPYDVISAIALSCKVNVDVEAVAVESSDAGEICPGLF